MGGSFLWLSQPATHGVDPVEDEARHIEEGMTPKNAALKAMEELSGPGVGIALVLQLPNSASLERTSQAAAQIEQILADIQRADAQPCPSRSTPVRISTLRYKGGTTTYLEVLDGQRSLYGAELTLASARGDEYRSLVQLYKALGGGWQQ